MTTEYFKYVSRNHGTMSVHKGGLVKTTPSGQKVVKHNDREIRFDKNGAEMGVVWSSHRLITEEEHDTFLEGRARLARSRAVRDKLRELADSAFNYYGSCDAPTLVEKLQELVAEAKQI